MTDFSFVHARSLAEARDLLRDPEVKLIGGGQSLLAAMKLGLARPRTLVALSPHAFAELEIRVENDKLIVPAWATHDAISRSATVKSFCPMIAALAHGIGDQQVRNMGTIGGAIAHNDPAACWPCALLALGAVVITSERTIEADDFFGSVYQTALAQDEIITAVQFPKPVAAHYIKFEQPASRFALVGVAVGQFERSVRVAITGLGHGVVRWREAETALSTDLSQAAMETVVLAPERATGDLHASADYRAHLSRVLTRRCIAQIKGEPQQALVPTAQHATTKVPTAQVAHDHDTPLHGSHTVNAPVSVVWDALMNPEVLHRCIRGCESFELIAPNLYRGTIRIGIGPIRATFAVDVNLSECVQPHSCTLKASGDSRSVGGGTTTAYVRLEPIAMNNTRIDWKANVEPHGKIAQLGARLIEASAQRITQDFFDAFAGELAPVAARRRRWWHSLMFWRKS